MWTKIPYILFFRCAFFVVMNKGEHFFLSFSLNNSETKITLILSFFLVAVLHSFIPLACAEFDDSLPFSGASSIPLCYVVFPATLPHQLYFHHFSPHLAICFLVYLSILYQNSYIIRFGEFCFLPFSIHVQTNIIYLTFLSLL